MIPMELWILLALLCAVTGCYALVRRARGSLLRLMVFAASLLVLADPSLVLEERETRKDIALLLVDRTPSQELGDRTAQTDQAAKAIDEMLAVHDQSLEVRRVKVTHGSLSEGRKGSRLHDALREAVADIPAQRLAGTILVTDGQVHDIPKAEDLEDKRQTAAPVHVLLTGAENDHDRRLVVVKAPGYGVVGEQVKLTVRVEDSLNQEGQAPLTLKIAGERVRRINVPIGRDVQLDVPLERRGRMLISLATEVVEGELLAENNQALVTVNAVRDRLRVLLVSGVPHPGERTWRNLLKADPSVDLVHFTILRPPEKQDGTPIHELSLIAFPTRELFQNKLEEFDLIVFDRYRRRGVLPSLYLRNIVEFVRNGGALLEVVGPGFAGPMSLYRTAMGEILPGEPTGAVMEQGFKPELTGDGLRHPITARLPGGPVVSLEDDIRWGRWFRQIEVRPRGGNVLMAGLDSSPLLVVDRVGKGRVAQLTSDQIWLWAKGYEGGGPYAELIRRLAHWLMKEPELEENDLRAKIRDNQMQVELRSLLPVSPVVDIWKPDGTKENLTLKHSSNGRYQGSVGIDQNGIYRITDGSHEVLAAVGGAAGLELAEVVSTDRLVSPLVRASKGSVRWIGGRVPDIRLRRNVNSSAGNDWIALRRNEDHVVTGLKVVSLLPAWLSLVGLLLLLLLAWRREAE